MIVKNTLPYLKLATAIFLSISVIFAVKFYQSQKQNTKLKESILLDKKTYSNDLEEIFNRYDAQVLRTENLKKQLLENNIISQKEFDEIVPPTKFIVSENKIVFDKTSKKTIDSLKLVIGQKVAQNTQLISQMEDLIIKNKELNKRNFSNEKVLTTAKNLTATNVYANGIKIVSNNIIETKRFNNTEQIKVCFTLLENNAAIVGNKDIFIQIKNPNNKVVTKNGDFVEYGDKILHYSAKTNVFYDREQLDVCAFVDTNKSDLLKGDYEINIFSGTNIIGSTTFSLK